MLSHLVIRNFAIIDELEIAFESGFTALTGETGAGKSIIIDALNLLLGGRASTEVIRTEEPRAVVEGVFEPHGEACERIAEFLDTRGIDFDGQLVVRRIVSRNGRNKVFINGSLTTVSNLDEATRNLVDISGQHEHYSLVRVDEHIDLVDSFAGLDGELDEMNEAFRQVRRVRRELQQLQEDARDRLNRIDFLRYQLEEIDSAELERGEEEEINERVQKLKHAEKISDALYSAAGLVHAAEASAVERLGDALAALRKVAIHDEAIEEFVDRLDEANTVVSDLARDIQDYGSGVQSDPHTLDKLIERQELIKDLRLKHGRSVAEILDQAEEMRSELHRLENAEEHGDKLEAELQKARQQAWAVARSLSKKRRTSAQRLQERIESELEQLNMDGARFRIDFVPEKLPGDTAPADGQGPTLGQRGFDTVEFLISPNVGEQLHPLADIASGGELSRIMLAIKSILVENDSVATYVFDEIDAGIGGTTADTVGAKIEATADSHQVLCITHLASIASRSDHHYLVEKSEVDGRTRSTIRPLDDDERVEAIAKMLGGKRANQKTRDAARELLYD